MLVLDVVMIWSRIFIVLEYYCFSFGLFDVENPIFDRLLFFRDYFVENPRGLIFNYFIESSFSWKTKLRTSFVFYVLIFCRAWKFSFLSVERRSITEPKVILSSALSIFYLFKE